VPELPTFIDPQREKLLLEKSRQDLTVFREIYAFYLPKVYAYVNYRVNRAQDAEDLASSVFLKVVERLDKFEWRGQGSFAAWLFKIAHDLVVDHYRQYSNDPQDIGTGELADTTPAALLPVDQMVQKVEFTHLKHLISQLSPRRQEIVTLKFYGGLRNVEIAQVLGLDEHTIASHLCRALNDLHQMYINGSSQNQNKEAHHER
jgi:RNA polymerase sigma-70 factor (ECF subfamily)